MSLEIFPPTAVGARRGPLGVGLMAAVFFGCVVLAGHIHGGLGPDELLRDPAAQHAFNPLSGLISHLGVLALTSASAICLFAALHTRHGSPYLTAIGLFGLAIAADDLFLLHEVILPHWVGVPEKIAISTWGILALAIGTRYRKDILSRDTTGLALAIVLLAGSVFLDALRLEGVLARVVEDGLKFVGLILWSSYWISRAGRALEED